MKKIVISVFLFLISICSGSVLPVFASNLPDVEVSIYLDGYPVDGTVIGESDVNVYKEGSFDEPIDTLVPGTVVTLKAQYAYANGSNYFYITYIKDDVEYYGLVDFYSIEPIGVVITPEGVQDITNDFSFQNIFEYVDMFWNLIRGLLDFLVSLPDIIFAIFPFFTVAQVALLCSLILIVIIISCYFIVKKVI